MSVRCAHDNRSVWDAMEAKGTRTADVEARKGQDKGSEKTSGHATTSGQDYEVALCCLVFLRALRVTGGDFFLLSNFAPAGNLDDVVLFYRLRGDAKYSAVLVQVKYRECPKWKKLTRSNPFSLAKYSASFAGFRALCAGGGVPLEGGLLEVGRVSAVLYSSDGCDFEGVACDVTADTDARLLRDLLDTGGRLLRVTGLGLPEDFADGLTLCTEQTCLDEADGHLERELRAQLALTASADVAELRTRLQDGVKRWWSAREGGRSLTARCPEWTDVLRLQVARLNGPQLNLDFSTEALASLRSALEQHELTWITMADERQARATRGRLLQALGGSCLVLDAAAGLITWDQVEALWGTAACPTVALDLSPGGPPPPAWSQLLGAVRGHRRLAVLALHGTPPPEARWLLLRAEPTWLVLDGATKDRLLVTEVSLQGHVVSLRDVLGEDAPPGVSDELISALCDPAAEVLRLGMAPDSSSLQNFVHRCLQRTSPGIISLDDLRRSKSLVFSYKHFSEYRLPTLSLQELESKKDIAQSTLVLEVPCDSEIRKQCCRLSVRGFSEDEWDTEFTEFVPFTWLCEHRVVIVEGVAGVGKSTFVTMMCSKVKQRFPASWVLRYDLAKHTDFIRIGNFSDIPGFLLRVLPEDRQSLLRELLEHSFYLAGNVFLFVDAFDEISPDYSAQCCQLLKGIASAVKFQQIVVTTRSVNTKDVEEALGTKAFSLPVFSEDEQDLFLERFYKSKDMLVERSTISSLREAAGQVMEVPLLCRMAAEVLLQSDDQNVLMYKTPWRKILLYKRFVEQTTVNRQAEKLDLPITLRGNRVLEYQSKEHLRNLQALAVRMLFPEVQLPNFVLSSEQPDEKLGLVVSDGTSLDFEHRTFAEYFLGRWLAQHWDQCPRELLREFLAREVSEFVAATLSWSLFEDSPPHLAVARGEEVRADTTDRGGRSVLHVAAMTPGVLLPEVSREVLHGQDEVLGATAARCAEMSRNWEFLEALTATGTTLEGSRFLVDQETAEKVLFEAVKWDLTGLFNVILHWHPGMRDLRFTCSHDTLLHVAAYFCSINVIRHLLMEQPRDVDIENYDRETPLHSSATRSHVEAVTLLLDKGADMNKQSTYGTTALMSVARGGLVELVKVLLEKGAETNIHDIHGNTAMMLAAREGHVEVVKVLLEEGVHTNIQAVDGVTALTLAARAGHADVLEVLIEKGADTNIKDKRGKTALMFAAEGGHVDVVEVLVEKGVDTDIQEQRGKTAMMFAAYGGHVEVVKVLLENKAKTNIQDTRGNTAMIEAARVGRMEVVKKLLEKGADTSIQDKLGNTAMMLAAERGHVDVVKLLLEAGADTNVQDTLGNTAIMIATFAGHDDVVEVLRERP